MLLWPLAMSFASATGTELQIGPQMPHRLIPCEVGFQDSTCLEHLSQAMTVCPLGSQRVWMALADL